jgi:hypothetical protein
LLATKHEGGSPKNKKAPQRRKAMALQLRTPGAR